jgi:hypothetical protein
LEILGKDFLGKSLQKLGNTWKRLFRKKSAKTWKYLEILGNTWNI